MLRDILRRNFLNVAGKFKSPHPSVYILNGHFVSRGKVDIHTKLFENQIKQLSNMAQLVDVETALNAIEEQKPIKETLIAFTFDDGFEECYSLIAPVLNQYNINAAFFINPGFIEGSAAYIRHFTQNVLETPNKNPMTWEQVKILSDSGFIIGNHTYNHVRLNIKDTTIIGNEVRQGKKSIESKIGKKCDYFAFPFGQLKDLSEEALEIISQEHQYIFSGADYKSYCSFGGRVHNRRHFEGNWPMSHLRYFLSHKRMY